MSNARPDADIVEVVNHDPGWHRRFLAERRRLRSAFGSRAISVEHIGSTAVAGLAAKPVIDILVGVREMRGLSQYRRIMKELGYVHVPHEEDSKRLFFYRGMPRIFHVHIVEDGGEEYLRHITFRNHLLGNARAREEYEALKLALARKYRNDREAYTQGKSEFIESVLGEIRSRNRL